MRKGAAIVSMITGAFAQLLYRYRKIHHYSQEKMAELCGVSTRHYQDLELGTVNPKLETAVRIAKVLDISLDSLKEKS